MRTVSVEMMRIRGLGVSSLLGGFNPGEMAAVFSPRTLINRQLRVGRSLRIMSWLALVIVVRTWRIQKSIMR
jgi:hypothetical protein